MTAGYQGKSGIRRHQGTRSWAHRPELDFCHLITVLFIDHVEEDRH